MVMGGRKGGREGSSEGITCLVRLLKIVPQFSEKVWSWNSSRELDIKPNYIIKSRLKTGSLNVSTNSNHERVTDT